MPDTTGDRSLTGRRGEDHRLGLCYAMLLGELTIYSLLHAARWRWPEAQSSTGLAIPLLFRHSVVQSTYDTPFPFDTNAYICSVAPCLRVLWMSTHGCFSPPFPLSFIRLLQPGVGVQEPDATVADDYYYSGGAYYYVQPADNDQE